MRVIAIKTLREFWTKHPDSEVSLRAWYDGVTQCKKWENPHDVLDTFNSADPLKNNRVVFNIAHNKYRLVVKVEYTLGLIYVCFIGTHREYEKIDAENVKWNIR